MPHVLKSAPRVGFLQPTYAFVLAPGVSLSEAFIWSRSLSADELAAVFVRGAAAHGCLPKDLAWGLLTGSMTPSPDPHLESLKERVSSEATPQGAKEENMHRRSAISSQIALPCVQFILTVRSAMSQVWQTSPLLA